MPKIVYVAPTNFPVGFLKVVQNALKKADVNIFDIHTLNMPANCLRKRTKTKYEAVPENEALFIAKLKARNPDFIVINDKAALAYITNYKYLSLALCRGSIYSYELNGKIIPCLVLDNIANTKYVKTAMWVLLNDCKKLGRWINGNVRKEPTFSYTVCKTYDALMHFNFFANESIALAIDIETSVGHISCIGYTCLQKSGKVHTYVIPFIDGSKASGCFWESEFSEIQAWEIVKQVNANATYKILQNGSYDAAWLLFYRMPMNNYIADTLHGWHSIWCELPKRLDFLASIALDTYTFWKDEGKEDAKEDTTKTKIPKSVIGMENYWRYNALDCHSTMGIWRFLLAHFSIAKLDWALVNYIKEFQQQFGPAFAMTMRGCNYNKKLHFEITQEMQTDVDKSKAELLIAVDDLEFNPNSPKQVKEIIYTVFKVKPYKRKGQTTDEKVLKMLYNQNPFAAWFMDKLWETKKPANNISKYGSNIGRGGRILYKLGAGITETGRYASRGHDFWTGINIQNKPYNMRPMIEPDEGYMLYNIDYAQSDAYFTAFDMQDEKFMEVMLSDKDTHCVHCEYFFKEDYEKLYAGHKNHEDWVSHNITGLRSITKRIVYGANYLMRGGTLLITMERAPVQTAAIALGYKAAANWGDAKLIKLCEAFLNSYFQMYPQLLPALAAKIEFAIANGNIATCAGGRTRMFFGDLRDDNIKRLFAAFFGQGGTAENINKALHNLYWSARGIELERAGHMMLFQVHDSLIGQVPIGRFDMLEEIKDIMENEIELHGRKFTVPCDVEVGLGWGKRLMSYRKDMTVDDLKTNDAKWWRKYNAN